MNMMKKLMLPMLLLLLLTTAGCRRRQLSPSDYVRVAVDTASHDDFEEDNSWQDEPLNDIPDIPGEAGRTSGSMREMDEYMKGN